MTAVYASHGYCGLSHNLQTPFEWTGGLGSSYAVMQYASQYFDYDVFPNTYVARTEQRTGWPARQNWATIYPWIASDFTFYGCIPFMYILGYLYSLTWIQGAVVQTNRPCTVQPVVHLHRFHTGQ